MHGFSLNDWLNYLENRHFEEIKFGLHRIEIVSKRLGVLKPTATVITVAGTNGKGSTVACLEEIYCKSGFNVGTYTSPHLINFNERIKINKTPVSDEKLCELFSEIECARKDVILSYFEVTTIAALLYFKQNNLDVILLEVGMGARLDATNIIESDLSIITTISFDHQKYLGNTLEEIAYEKAGVMRRGKPVIYIDEIAREVFCNQAKIVGGDLYLLNEHFTYEDRQDSILVKIHNKFYIYPKGKINIKAAVGSIVAVKLLAHQLPVEDEHICKALRAVSINARLQYIPGKINVILDVAHNTQAVELLSAYIKKTTKKGRKVHGVFSALKDKDLSGLIDNMRENVDYWYPVIMDTKNSCTESELLKALNFSAHKSSFCFKNALIAFETALKCARIDDLIVVYGSFLLVGPILRYINENKLLNERSLDEILS